MHKIRSLISGKLIRVVAFGELDLNKLYKNDHYNRNLTTQVCRNVPFSVEGFDQFEKSIPAENPADRGRVQFD